MKRELLVGFFFFLYHNYQGVVLLSPILRLPEDLSYCPEQEKAFWISFVTILIFLWSPMGAYFSFLHYDLGKTIIYKPVTDESVLFSGAVKYSSESGMYQSQTSQHYFDLTGELKNVGISPAVPVFLLSSCIHFKRPIQLKRYHNESKSEQTLSFKFLLSLSTFYTKTSCYNLFNNHWNLAKHLSPKPFRKEIF